MRLFDTHAHLNDEQYNNDRETMIQACFDAGIEYIVIPSVDRGTCQSGIALAEGYDNIYAAVGVHPCEVAHMTEDDLDYYKDMALRHDKVRAVGEIGLDYYWDKPDRDIQKKAFRRQMDLAQEVQLPILIHDRDAHGDTMNIIRDYKDKVWGVFHCYSGSWEMARQAIDLGYYISFAGPVAFKNSHSLKEVAKQVPMDRILIETDSPYLTPPPFRGKRNDPSKVQFVAMEIARLKGMDVDEFTAQTLENGKRVFAIE